MRVNLRGSAIPTPTYSVGLLVQSWKIINVLFINLHYNSI